MIRYKQKAKEGNAYLSCFDDEQFKTWDDPLVPFTDEHAAEIRTYMEEHILDSAKSTYDNIRLIYDWIHTNVTHTHDGQKLDPYGVFTTGLAVCGGFSNLYKAMLNLAGVPAITVYGNSSGGSHQWNLVYLEGEDGADGRWFSSDATWGGNGWFDMDEATAAKDHAIYNLYNVTNKLENGAILGFQNGLAVVGVAGEVSRLEIPDDYQNLPITGIASTVFQEKVRYSR